MDERLLASLGLNHLESKLFRMVLKAGETTPAILGKAIGVKRTTAYAIARSVAEKGFLKEDTTKRPKTFSPASPEGIEDMFQNEKKRLTVREGLFKSLAGELSRVSAETEYPVPEIRFIREEQLEAFLYRETMKWYASMMECDATWWGFQDHTFIDHFGKITRWYWKKAPRPHAVKLLSNRSLTEFKMKGRFPGRQIKFWDGAAGFLSTIWVVGAYIVVLNTRKKPFYLLEIYDETLANDLREVFKNLWPLV